MTKLELLAPAKNPDIARIAIDYGADAVYIGAERFGARGGATNSMQEIAALTDYAHKFGARIYLTVNTIIYDNELENVRQTIIGAYNAGVDAVIVQDMAIMELDLPPIELHASTQTFALTPERVKFLADAGFSRVILERAVSLDEIRAIGAVTDVELEAFVHGAICVGYSGQCYLSQTLMGVSGNRGECAQPCRWTYNLLDENFKRILSDKHLLSVRDMDLSVHIPELIEAGITSFKIEGRLKDADYIKNSVSHYRRIIDAYIADHKEFKASADGVVKPDFMSDPKRTFSRGFSDYFINGATKDVSSLDTPKSIGQRIGVVTSVKNDFIVMRSDEPLRSGDGICFIAADGKMRGTNVNKVDGDRVFPNVVEGIESGMEIFRNYDHAFALTLDRSRTRRLIPCRMAVECYSDKLILSVTDNYGHNIVQEVVGTFEPSRNSEAMLQTVKTQLAKSGDTIFTVDAVKLLNKSDDPNSMPFIAVSVLNDLRRRALDALVEERLKLYKRPTPKNKNREIPYPASTVDFRANIVNNLSERFYKSHGVSDLERGFELSKDHVGKLVMTSRYCLRRELGQCLVNDAPKYRNQLFIENNFHTFELSFDCKKCEMSLIYRGSR